MNWITLVAAIGTLEQLGNGRNYEVSHKTIVLVVRSAASYYACSNRYKSRLTLLTQKRARSCEVPAIQIRTASKVSGGLLIFTAALGIALLIEDNVLRTGAVLHYYALITFVALDVMIGIAILAKPTMTTFSIAMGWVLLRIIVQFADLSQASVYQFANYAQFADYLFNPASGVSASFGNPPGVPGTLIDIIVLSEIVVLAIAWKGRSGR